MRRTTAGLVAVAVCLLIASCGGGEAKRIVSELSARRGSPIGSAPGVSFDTSSAGLTPRFGRGAEPPSAHVVFPSQSNGRVRLEDVATGTIVAFKLQGSRQVRAETGNGYLVYRGAHPSGAALLHRALPSGTEDYVAFEARPSEPSVAYQLTIGPNVAGLRLVENTLEMLDAGGAPRLRVAPPYLIGADGKRTDAVLAVEDCSVDTGLAPPWGRDVTPPGADTCVVRVRWNDAGVAYPAVLDPKWTTTGSLTVARQDHTMTLLPLTGKVLVVGGRSSPTSTTGLASAELYDKNTGTWATTGSLTGGRWSHSATLLNSSSNSTTSQKVLVAGGINGSTSVATAMLYSQTAGTWVAAGTMNAARHLHAAALLADGRVLVAGGMNGTSVLQSAALYNPASGSGAWAATTGPIPPAGWRFGTATLIQTTNQQLNNKVVLAGGNDGTNSLSSAFLFDPAQSAFSTLASMPSAREGHTAVALSGGKILFAGGKSGSTTLATAVVFDPSSGPGSWSTTGSMSSRRSGHAMNALPAGILATGQAIVSGGSDGTSTLASTEVWNGSTWALDAPMAAPVQQHRSLILANKILIAGGSVSNGATTVAAAELYDPSLGLSCSSGSQCASGFCVNGVCCDTSCTDQCHACNVPGSVGTCAPKSNGATCSDGNGCTQGDTCQAGTCTAGSPVTCTALDQCHLPGTCNPGTGTCSNPTKANGTTCNDANACTQTDTCQAGTCTGMNPVVCTALDQCHAVGTCNPTTGACSNPNKANGTACDDTNACSQNDTCTGGVCDGIKPSSCATANDVIVALAGIATDSAGATKAIFTYTTDALSLAVPYGPQNSLSDQTGVISAPRELPPQVFVLAAHPAFVATLSGTTLTWQVGTHSATATRQSPTLPTQTQPDGTKDATLPDGSKINIDSTPPAEPAPGREPDVGLAFAGEIAGQLSVSPSGAAMYTVPVRIPPGTAGMAPNLNLVYSSQGADGIAGQGFDLTGVSVIQRCPRTRAKDGITQAVRMSQLIDGELAIQGGDGVCLDGERLFYRRRTNSGEAGDEVFEPERQDFGLITLHGSGTTAFFSVRTKSGETRFYGLRGSVVRFPIEEGAPGVAAPSDGKATAVWPLDTVVDAWGNAYEIHYNDNENDFDQRGLVVTDILYTGRYAGSVLTGTQTGIQGAFETVHFDYQARQDVRNMRFRSSTLSRKSRLKKISTSAGFYRLTYVDELIDPRTDFDGPFLPSRLLTLEHCRATSSNSENCEGRMQFDWDGGGYQWDPADAYKLPADIGTRLEEHFFSTPEIKFSGSQLVDIDGDGRLDFVRMTGGQPNAGWRNTGSGWDPMPSTSVPPGYDGSATLGNFDKLVTGDNKPGGSYFADLDGDGVLDFMSSPHQDACDCQTISINGFCLGVEFCTGFFPPQAWLNRVRTEGRWVEAPALEQVPSSFGVLDLTNTDFLRDMNGDGLVDIVRLDSSHKPQVLINMGASVGWLEDPAYEPTLPDGEAKDYALKDIDGDGTADLVHNNSAVLYAGSPSSSVKTIVTTIPADLVTNGGFPGDDFNRPGDVDGDGRRDVLGSFSTFDANGMPVRQVNLNLGNGLGWSSGASDFMRVGYVASLVDVIPAVDRNQEPVFTEYATLADINADGLSDLIVTADTISTLPNPNGTVDHRGIVYFNNGTRWLPKMQALDGDPIGANPVPFAPLNSGDQPYTWADLDGDGVIDIAGHDHAWLNRFKPPVIKGFPGGVSNAIAGQTQVGYAVITTVDAQTTTAQHPIVYSETNFLDAGTRQATGPLRVVASVTADNGVGGTGVTTYQYTDLRDSVFGRGLQGFRAVAATDPSGIQTATVFLQSYPYTGLPFTVSRTSVDLTTGEPTGPVSTVQTIYCDVVPDNGTGVGCTPKGSDPGFAVTLFPHPSDIQDTRYLRSSTFPDSGPPSVKTTTDIFYDGRGNPLTTRVTMEHSTGSEKHISTTENTYGDAGSDEERMGKVTFSKVTTQRLFPQDGNNAPVVHQTRFDYGNVNAFTLPDGSPAQTLALTKKKVEPGAAEPFELHTAYAYDASGNIVTTTDCATDFMNCAAGAVGPSALPYRTMAVSFDPADFNAPQGNPPLVSTLPYNQKGRFPVKTTNSAGHIEYAAYDPRFGTPTQKTGPNGVHTCYAYDDFGRETTEIVRCGTVGALTTTTEFHTTSEPLSRHTSTVMIVRPPTGSPSWTYVDSLGRTVRTVTRNFGGSFVQTDTVFDAVGRVHQISKPHLPGATVYFTTNTYDPLGRVQEVDDDLGPIAVNPDSGAQTTGASSVITTYSNMTVTATRTVQGEPRTQTEVKNIVGKVVSVTTSVTASNDVTITYGYDGDGNLTSTHDPVGNSVGIVYDLRGRKQQTSDPDLGTWRYDYDGFGDLVGQTDAKGQLTKMAYDVLGRMTTKTACPAGSTVANCTVDPSTTAQWVYDGAPGAGIGKLAAMVSAPDTRLQGTCSIPSTTMTGGSRAGRSFTYTAFGDVDEVTECVDGTSFATKHQYDPFGREGILTYPAVKGTRFAVQYNYTSAGYLQYITNFADGEVLWATQAMNELGQVTSETLANGVSTAATRSPSTGWLLQTTSTAAKDGGAVIQNVTNGFDEIGNLRARWRRDQVIGANSQETFGYDLLDRLTSSRVQVPSIGNYDVTETYSFDDNGNPLTKNGVIYTYQNCPAGAREAGPHAVCRVGSGPLFAYDGNGNLTAGSGRTIDYDRTNKPTHITSAAGTADYIYGADANRVVQEVTPPSGQGGTTARTVYAGLGATGKSFYERTTRGSTIEHSHFIYAGGAHSGNAVSIRIATETTGSTSPPTVVSRYNHFDHLGSVVAVSDEHGHVPGPGVTAPDTGVLGYDPWGARREPDGRTAASTSTFSLPPGHRTFTSQEAIPNVGLVNMNGRVYDPVLGRFLSPDPNVQFGANLQSYNRYSYVLNNPLRYTDPTGYFSVQVGPVGEYTLMAVTIVACAYGGAGCYVALGVSTTVNAAAQISNGAPWDQVIGASVMSLAFSYALGGMGDPNGDLSSQLLMGGITGAAGTTFDSMVTGDFSNFGTNILVGIGGGAAGAAASYAFHGQAPVSQASVARAQGLDPEQIETTVFGGPRSASGSGKSLNFDIETRPGQNDFQLSGKTRGALQPVFDAWKVNVDDVRLSFSDTVQVPTFVASQNRILLPPNFYKIDAPLRDYYLVHETAHYAQFVRLHFNAPVMDARGDRECSGANCEKSYNRPQALRSIELDRLDIIDSRFNLEAIAHHVGLKVTGYQYGFFSTFHNY